MPTAKLMATSFYWPGKWPPRDLVAQSEWVT